MNRKYIIGVGITVLVLTINQVFIQYWLKQKQDDAAIINISGKQRMLSQKISALFYQSKYQNQSKESLQKVFYQWKDTHQNLLSIHENYTEKTKNEIHIKLLDIGKNISFIQSFINKNDISKSELNEIYLNQQDFLIKMDSIVYLFQKDANNKLSFIVRIEYILFSISLLILILEVFLIYKPITKNLKLVYNNLKLKNNALNESIKDIEIKNFRLEEYIYLTSHNLQEPLKAIYSIANILSEQYKNKFDKQGNELLNHLKLKSKKMSEMIKVLLDYNVIGKDSVIEITDLNTILEQVYMNLQDERIETDATISWSKLPTIHCMPYEIKTLFYNLISNAIKFSKENTKPIISIDFKEEEKNWLFWVKDNGIGLSVEIQEKVFKIFQKGNEVNKYSGDGVGLALCKKIVELHKGKIWVESPKNNFTYFYFKIKK